MKKLFILLAAALVSFNALGQVRIAGAASIGGYDKMNDISSEVGGAARIFYDYNIGTIGSGEQYAISVGAGYLMNNISTKGTAYEGKMNTSWLQIPVALTSFYPIGSGDLYASVGVYYAYGISGKIEASSGSVGASIDILHNETSSVNILKAHDFGFIGQAGYCFPFNVGIYVGYNRGLLNIAAQSDSEAKNELIEAGIFYRF